MMPRLEAITILTLATLFVPAVAQNMDPARPGSLNYVEGQASMEGHPITPQSIGRTELQAGQYLATANGKAEVLLSPGIFLRLDKNSTIKMVSPDLIHTEVEVTQGRVSVEADQLFKQNNILIDQKNGQTHLLQNGLYEFNADANTVRVFDGKAEVFTSVSPQPGEKPVTLKGGHQLMLTGEAVQAVKFDKKQAQNEDLYRWSGLRSEYLGEANVDLAQEYAGAASFNPGWYWNSSLYGYTWLPGDGLFWNPFGYGFYSPYYIYGGGYVYNRGLAFRGYPYGYHGGWGGRPGYGGRGPGVYRGGNASGFRGGNPGGASRGGFGSAGGGGFHGGGGGGAHGGGGGHR